MPAAPQSKSSALSFAAGMPTLRHPDVNVALGVASPQKQGPSRAHIYLALAVITLLLVARIVKPRRLKPSALLPAPGDCQRAEKVDKHPPRFSPIATSPTSQKGNRPVSVLSPWSQFKGGKGVVPFTRLGIHQQHPSCAAVLTGHGAQRAVFGFLGQTPAMDDNENDPLKDRLRSGSASRGVSTNVPDDADFRYQHDPSPAGRYTEQHVGDSRPSYSSHFFPSNFPEGYGSGGSEGMEIGPMSGYSSFGDRDWSAASDQQAGSSSAVYGQDPNFGAESFTGSPGFSGFDLSTPRRFSRPPPPPPLTPPTRSDNRFPFEDRHIGYAASIPPELDASFIHQPNPAYSGMSTSDDVLNSSPQTADPIPRRRSYTRTVPIGIPVPGTTPAYSAEAMASGTAFTPSSYPPTSPLLPPPPPGPDAPSEYVFVGGPGGPGVVLSDQEIDLHGEIISVMDHSGHGWKRHTRVYGGGVCLACLAAEDQGGFYGDTVPLSDRR
ncbi:hypothetical protein QC762_214130 [Podospora pseudocomata]|uniref:Uncharacterized protein n=1 Tax=Podospora pseudocomata TaxID=2093779 RepID=A0ABR0GP46_9PEZI|nr:hypothetical protein QC762_214130 [Podospora pseudocomata]